MNEHTDPREERQEAPSGQSSAPQEPAAPPDSSPAQPDKPAAANQQPAPGKQRSVFQYITVLFAAAFFLLLLTFLMERRSSQAEMDSLRGDSASAWESVQNMMAENQELKNELNILNMRLEALESQESALQEELDLTKTQADTAQRQVRAMELLLELEQAYSRGRYTTARQVIQNIRDLSLDASLPDTNQADPESPSPLERYQTICGALGVD